MRLVPKVVKPLPQEGCRSGSPTPEGSAKEHHQLLKLVSRRQVLGAQIGGFGLPVNFAKMNLLTANFILHSQGVGVNVPQPTSPGES